jgi:hypothetical protein
MSYEITMMPIRIPGANSFKRGVNLISQAKRSMHNANANTVGLALHSGSACRQAGYAFRVLRQNRRSSHSPNNYELIR